MMRWVTALIMALTGAYCVYSAITERQFYMRGLTRPIPMPAWAGKICGTILGASMLIAALVIALFWKS
jgi:hypothetical protein